MVYQIQVAEQAQRLEALEAMAIIGLVPSDFDGQDFPENVREVDEYVMGHLAGMGLTREDFVSNMPTGLVGAMNRLSGLSAEAMQDMAAWEIELEIRDAATERLIDMNDGERADAMREIQQRIEAAEEGVAPDFTGLSDDAAALAYHINTAAFATTAFIALQVDLGNEDMNTKEAVLAAIYARNPALRNVDDNFINEVVDNAMQMVDEQFIEAVRSGDEALVERAVIGRGGQAVRNSAEEIDRRLQEMIAETTTEVMEQIQEQTLAAGEIVLEQALTETLERDLAIGSPASRHETFGNAIAERHPELASVFEEMADADGPTARETNLLSRANAVMGDDERLLLMLRAIEEGDFSGDQGRDAAAFLYAREFLLETSVAELTTGLRDTHPAVSGEENGVTLSMDQRIDALIDELPEGIAAFAQTEHGRAMLTVALTEVDEARANGTVLTKEVLLESMRTEILRVRDTVHEEGEAIRSNSDSRTATEIEQERRAETRSRRQDGVTFIEAEIGDALDESAAFREFVGDKTSEEVLQLLEDTGVITSNRGSNRDALGFLERAAWNATHQWSARNVSRLNIETENDTTGEQLGMEELRNAVNLAKFIEARGDDMLDRDGDGKLSNEEVQAGLRLMALVDIGENGISRGEMHSAHEILRVYNQNADNAELENTVERGLEGLKSKRY